MKFLYLFLDLFVFLGPFALSFDKKVRYVNRWKSVFLSTLIIAIPFLVWDYYFTEHGFWGFNPDYLVGIYLGNLPLEEVLFFIVVPFACTFIYECCRYYFLNSDFSLLDSVVKIFIPLYAIFISLATDQVGWYTISVVFTSAFTLFLWMKFSRLKFIGVSFLISLVPFLLINGVLTGGVTEEPIVWYSELQKIPFRIFTIPMEDVLYCFTLIVSVILLHEAIQKKLKQ